MALQPVIGETLAAVRRLPGARLTRMSGSGATVFALFDTPQAAESAGDELRGRRQDWWIRPAILAG